MTAQVEQREFEFEATSSSGDVSAILVHPADAHTLFVFAHGAGAGMRHVFMETLAQTLAGVGVATMRYQFPYTQRGTRRIDPRPVLLKTVRSAVATAHELDLDLPIVAGGKSMGGRMTSMAHAAEPLEGCAGLVFVGFPLHPAGKPGIERAEHLQHIGIPTLFLQGTRDKLADLELLRPVVDGMRPSPTLHIVDGADHGFHVLKRSGRTDDEVMAELAETTADWCRDLGSS